MFRNLTPYTSRAFRAGTACARCGRPCARGATDAAAAKENADLALFHRPFSDRIKPVASLQAYQDIISTGRLSRAKSRAETRLTSKPCPIMATATSAGLVAMRSDAAASHPKGARLAPRSIAAVAKEPNTFLASGERRAYIGDSADRPRGARSGPVMAAGPGHAREGRKGTQSYSG